MGDRSYKRARRGWQAALALVTLLVISLVGGGAAQASSAGPVLQPVPTAYSEWGIAATMAYDPDTAQLVLFGGISLSGDCGCDGSGGTWVWNGTDFTRVVPPGSGSLYGHIVYDGATHQLLRIDGSETDTSAPLGTMYLWTGSSWTLLQPVHQPSPRLVTAVAYDAKTQQLLLFGGFVPGTGQVADTWSWNGSDWVQLNPTTSPPARAQAVMAYDDATGQLILAGGEGIGVVPLVDTWTWTGSTWKQLHPVASPGNLVNATAGYDPELHALEVFGGMPAPAPQPQGVNQMWKWTGANWQPVPSVVSPSDVNWPLMAYDQATAQMVLLAPNRDKVGGLLHTLLLVAAPTKTTLTAASSTVVAGQPVSIVAKVAAQQVAVPGGSVTFTDDNVAIPGCAAVPVVGGSATCTYAPAGGTQKVRAQYAPVPGYLASSARSVTLTVG